MLLPSRLSAFTLIFYTAILFSWAIPLNDDSGILYRFSPASSRETEQLLSWAEVRLHYAIVDRRHVWSSFSAAQMGFVATDPFLHRRLLLPSRYRRGRAWAPALPFAPGHQPPHGPGQEDVLVLVRA